MKVYKFGGASVKSAEAVINLYEIVKNETEELVIVVSAMDKTTNGLEALHELAFNKHPFVDKIKELSDFHNTIIRQLFPDKSSLESVTTLLNSLEQSLKECHRFSKEFTYSQIVSYGELLSTRIVSEFLASKGAHNTFVDARKCIQTDNTWKEGIINWDFTRTFVTQFIKPALKNGFVVTQGFIGASPDGHTTTLGREGSDFTAAIIASCLDAESVTVWKDVEGILTADPKLFEDPKKIDFLSYRETVEMAYYGASVIHPKTIKPLSEKHIPLYVRSFLNPDKAGTQIKSETEQTPLPSLILKSNQCLITFSNKDLSFTDEQSIGEVLQYLSKERIKISLIQSSATSFSVCIDYERDKVERILKQLNHLFTIHYNHDLHLLTIKNYDEQHLTKLDDKNSELYLEQKTRNNVRVLYKVKKNK